MKMSSAVDVTGSKKIAELFIALSRADQKYTSS
jgi:hypothetical protein